ncbi:MAG: hypothetical protein IPM47_19415 [Sphingobacteriales bacterium]|nr:MAG: hypothetical protein IPM47_19415 [Sphingobacteriales bacterium]
MQKQVFSQPDISLSKNRKQKYTNILGFGILTRNSPAADAIICLERSISAENPVRFIDAFVEHLDLSKSG